MNRRVLSKILMIFVVILSGIEVVTAQDGVTYTLSPNTLPIGSSPTYGVYLTASDNSSLKSVKVNVPAGMGVAIEGPTILVDNDKRIFMNLKVDSIAQPTDVLVQVTNGSIVKTTLLKLVKRLPVPPDATEGGVFAYVTLVDAENVHDIFGRRIGHRYIALQVTIENLSNDLDYLIHDVSLDLNEVFPAGATPSPSPATGTVTPDQRQKGPGLEATPLLSPDDRGIGPYRYRLSSLELSLLRGTAEKGQGQDRRNLTLRVLRGVGSLAATFIGVTTVGHSYAPAIAMFNGPLLTSYTDVFPDYTINQLNRLNDTAYRANTLVPRGQSKAIVVFIPQKTFLTDEQRKVFRLNPVLLAFPQNGRIDFRKATAVVHGTQIVEVKNQVPQITTVMFDSSTTGNFQNARPTVKGRVVGKYLSGADIKLAQVIPGVSVVKEGSSTDTELKFVLKADQPIKPDAPISIEVSNGSGAATYGAFASFTPVAPVITKVEPEQAEQDVERDITITGEHFISNMQPSDIIFDPAAGITVQKVTVDESSLNSIKVTLKIAKDAAEGKRTIRLRTTLGGLSQETKPFTIKKKGS